MWRCSRRKAVPAGIARYCMCPARRHGVLLHLHTARHFSSLPSLAHTGLPKQIAEHKHTFHKRVRDEDEQGGGSRGHEGKRQQTTVPAAAKKKEKTLLSFGEEEEEEG